MACSRAVIHLNDNDTDFNLTMDFPPAEQGTSEELYQVIGHLVKGVLLPVVFSFGICGNTLSIIVFAQKRSRHGLDRIELSATLGLLTLSISDLLFCLSGFPAVFLEKYSMDAGMQLRTLVAFYYAIYHKAAMNLFLFISTWLIVLVAAERYIAVCHPFRARNIIKVSRTLAAQSTVIVFSLLLNLPVFFEDYIRTDDCGDCKCLMKAPGFMRVHKSFAYTHRLTWFTLGTFIPLLLLLFFNVCILYEIYKSSSRSAQAEGESHSTSRITLILVAMIILFFLMVAPSMLLVFIGDFIDFTKHSANFMHNFRIAVVLTNLTQAIKFACNFLLYCSFNKKFRETVSKGKCGSSTKTTSSFGNSSTNRYHLVEVSGQKTICSSFSRESCYA